MKVSRIIIIVVMTVSTACSAIPAGNDIVDLSAAEKVASQALAERIHNLQSDRQKVQIDYNIKMNRLAEEESQIGLESNSLCYQFQKAHKLDMGTKYNLDVWKGQLVKVK